MARRRAAALDEAIEQLDASITTLQDVELLDDPVDKINEAIGDAESVEFPGLYG